MSKIRDDKEIRVVVMALQLQQLLDSDHPASVLQSTYLSLKRGYKTFQGAGRRVNWIEETLDRAAMKISEEDEMAFKVVKRKSKIQTKEDIIRQVVDKYEHPIAMNVIEFMVFLSVMSWMLVYTYLSIQGG